MDNFQKYSRLMLLIAGAVLAFILGIALLIFILRLFSSTLIHIPGFDGFFAYVILIIPYLIFYTAYYFLYQNIRGSKSRLTKLFASIVLVIGLLVCSITLILTTIVFAGVKIPWLTLFSENSGYALVFQIVLVLIIAGVIAAGSAKEKDWMERGKDHS